jgi:CheY-like chemotaxis protein
MAQAKLPSLKRLSVLIVSPDRYFRGMLVEILSGYGYANVWTADSLRSLFNYMVRAEVDLVILDENMPVLSSAEICRMVRNNPSDVKVPRSVLVVSQATRTLVDDARHAGFDALITKPVIPARLAKTMENLYHFGAVH